jgi:unsaturated rhamnogalacturonyl hydrolase
MKVTNDILLKKINLLVEKLMNLGVPTCETDINDKAGLSKGLIPRDFGIQEWDWPQGVGLYGLQKLQAFYKDGRYDDFFINWYKTNLEIGLPSKNVNTTAPFLPLVDLCDMLNDPVYEDLCIKRAEWLMEYLPRTKEGAFQHVTSAIGDRLGVRLNESEMWIDTIFMTVLFLNKMGHKYNRKDWISESTHQILLHIKYLFEKKTGLFYHGWSFNENTNFGEIFWCRGNSWFTFGIIDFLEASKSTLDSGVKAFILDTFKAQVNALVKLQAPSGLWHTVLDDSTSYEEVSGSAAIVTGILKAIKLGLLDESYQIYADKAVDAICKNIDKDGTVLNVSAGTGMGYDADHYKNIILAPMAYGQSLALTALCEALV